MTEKDYSAYFEQPEFKDTLARYEAMTTRGERAYFDPEQLTDIAEYYATRNREKDAEKVIDYALANSTKKATYEPYEYMLAGTVVEIKDGFVYIDDSVMCVKPDEGMVFRVSMEDIRIRRCIEYAGVGVGDLVVVTFRGGIAVEDGNLILDARSIDEGVWIDGGVAVPE